jgi:hypothetical protein
MYPREIDFPMVFDFAGFEWYEKCTRAIVAGRSFGCLSEAVFAGGLAGGRLEGDDGRRYRC